MGIRLEDVTPGALVGGIAGDSAVTVVAVRWIGSNALQLTYRTDGGRLDERLLYRDHEPRLTLRQASAAYDFSSGSLTTQVWTGRSTTACTWRSWPSGTGSGGIYTRPHEAVRTVLQPFGIWSAGTTNVPSPETRRA
jgi:hypothetical protein